MTSFVIASRDQKKREEYVSDYCRKSNIDKYDITSIGKDNQVKENAQSIGIDEIKNLHKKIFLKPIKSEIKAVIIEDAHLLTSEAQNALLKVLEEPPDHTIIMLSTDSRESLLPTILSRCQILELQTEIAELSDDETKEFSEFIANLESMPIGERLKKAEILSKDKDEAIEWIGKLLLVLRDKMLENYFSTEQSKSGSSNNLAIQQFNNWIISFQQLHKLLKTTNINPRFAIENTLLSL